MNRKVKSKPSGKKDSNQSKTFNEIYLTLNDKFKILEGRERLAKTFSINAVKGDSSEFFSLFTKASSKKLRSIISQVIKTKHYKKIEGRIEYNNRRLVCSIDIIPRGKTALILIKNITKKIDTINKLKISQKQLRILAKHLNSIREEERLYIAREFHDDLGHKLTALQIETGLLLKKMKNKDYKTTPKQIYEDVKLINYLINESLNSKKLFLTKFRLDFLEEMGLIESINHYLEEFQSRYFIEYYFYSDWKHIDLQYNKSVALYRILQEAVTNVAKHSKATKIDVSLEERNNRIYMTIEDNGIGIDKKIIEKTNGIGLIGMKERIMLEGGTFSIKGTPGQGTKLQVTVKLY